MNALQGLLTPDLSAVPRGTDGLIRRDKPHPSRLPDTLHQGEHPARHLIRPSLLQGDAAASGRLSSAASPQALSILTHLFKVGQLFSQHIMPRSRHNSYSFPSNRQASDSSDEPPT